MKREQVDLGWVDIPKNYNQYTYKEKKAVCNRLIDLLLLEIDRELDPTINRISFLEDVLESSLISNEQLEHYEVCEVLLDCRKLLNED
jgi:hypothetical protein